MCHSSYIQASLSFKYKNQVKQFKVRHLQQESLISSAQVQMAQHIQLLNILHSLIISSDEDMVHVNKETFADLSRHLQQTHETIEFLQLE